MKTRFFPVLLSTLSMMTCAFLRSVPEALRYLEEGHAEGKVVIRVE
ncbi:MAG: hypothetical protein PHY09_04485 [Desulfuromonadaceae bacterium]|nr:hypothetical protein [Desulfuromonadaceae bacterium]MDD5105697.1 hypothetical protein [Desulfuromonadaceae bacterium]